jgi:hypothetical protein
MQLERVSGHPAIIDADDVEPGAGVSERRSAFATKQIEQSRTRHSPIVTTSVEIVAKHRQYSVCRILDVGCNFDI